MKFGHNSIFLIFKFEKIAGKDQDEKVPTLVAFHAPPASWSFYNSETLLYLIKT